MRELGAARIAYSRDAFAVVGMIELVLRKTCFILVRLRWRSFAHFASEEHADIFRFVSNRIFFGFVQEGLLGSLRT